MAFGVTREQVTEWKRQVSEGRIAFLTHYWIHPSFPDVKSVTKVGCADIERLRAWAVSHGLPPQYIHYRDRYPHYDIFGERQAYILRKEGQWEQLRKFVPEAMAEPHSLPPAGSSSRSHRQTASDVTDKFDSPASFTNGERERK
ncbi:hypothetical protein [Paenibacillus sp.]|uniref:hypothetical protein n=1 Tax=Paenibacillus sp. TaxID=58172 RepID=UPI002D2FBBD9|nr:hypothetical protein [Paenibacillus sp.]HZG56986.1 hypothetical protein [Paenibacillus sp.]